MTRRLSLFAGPIVIAILVIRSMLVFWACFNQFIIYDGSLGIIKTLVHYHGQKVVDFLKIPKICQNSLF